MLKLKVYRFQFVLQKEILFRIYLNTAINIQVSNKSAFHHLLLFFFLCESGKTHCRNWRNMCFFIGLLSIASISFVISQSIIKHNLVLLADYIHFLKMCKFSDIFRGWRIDFKYDQLNIPATSGNQSCYR